MTTPLTIPRLISGGVITNYFCGARCAHCLYNCSPDRAREYLDSKTLLTILAVSRDRGCHSVHIGGGEPFLRPDKLTNLAEVCQKTGVKIEYIETNAGWFNGRSKDFETLTDLKKAGVSTLLISISPFHNESIPLNRTVGLIETCQRLGINVFPWQGHFLDDLSTLDSTRSHELTEYKSRFGDDYLEQIRDRYWIHMGGRALETYRPSLGIISLSELMKREKGCHCRHELTDTSHFHIDLFGNYIPGLCAGLAVDLVDLASPLNRERYPVITALANGGITELVEFTRSLIGIDSSAGAYINKCDLCNELRARLTLSGFQSRDLQPIEYYGVKKQKKAQER